MRGRSYNQAMHSAQQTVLITETLDESCAAWLQARLPAGSRVLWAKAEDAAPLDHLLPLADALVVRTYTLVNAELLRKAPRLRVVGRAGVGLDNVDLDACKAAGVRVVSTPDANSQAVVEYVFGLILDHYRPRAPLPRRADDKTFHALRKTEVGREIADLTLGIVGMGRIGKRIATVAHALGMRVLGTDVLPEARIRDELPQVPFGFVTHADLYRNSDIVTAHADGRAENKKLMGHGAFQNFGSQAVFINAARGMLVDDAAVAAWLCKNPEAHAYLDVHEPEPPPAGNPLWDLPNATLLPHLASRTDTAMRNMSWVVKDVLAVLEGREPKHPAA